MKEIELWKAGIAATTVLVSLIGLAWGIRKDIHLRVDRLRQDFKFALELRDQISNVNMDVLIKERGYHALVGRSDVAAPVIEYLIGLREPDRAIRLYRVARSRLIFVSLGSRKRLVFKGVLRSERLRQWVKLFSWIGYIVLYVVGASPILLGSLKWIKSDDAIVLGIFTFLTFLPASILVLRYGVKIKAAEELLLLRIMRNKVRI
ncbi:hypothetical protein [Xanthomonas arboricola]|uniref:hypothetical protein n=1 Tax=Xanthomonas arboricola TaxID=56448 RepID=UPI0011B0417F|nr:hypothetical protein [Xanthomonas arboricola]